MQRVSEAGLEDEIVKTPVTEYDRVFNDFLNGKYEVIRKEI